MTQNLNEKIENSFEYCEIMEQIDNDHSCYYQRSRFRNILVYDQLGKMSNHMLRLRDISLH